MTVIALPPEQLSQLADMVADRLRGAAPVSVIEPLTCEQFGARIGRGVEYVQDCCRIGMIRALPGKPYRILPEELHRYLQEGPRTGTDAKPRRRMRRAVP